MISPDSPALLPCIRRYAADLLYAIKAFWNNTCSDYRMRNKDIFETKRGIDREKFGFHPLALDFVMTFHSQGEESLSIGHKALVIALAVC